MAYNGYNNTDTMMSLDPGEFFAITKSDSTTYENLRGIYVGTAGDVALVGASGAASTFKAVPAGTFIPARITKVMSTNTTAADIVGLR